MMRRSSIRFSRQSRHSRSRFQIANQVLEPSSRTQFWNPVFESRRTTTMASFSIPLTGLEADSTALNTIANDLSNMNTNAFKAQSTNFADLFYQQIATTGAGDPVQVGAGVQVASNEIAFTQGSINSTGNSTDVALNGNGFFVVGNGEGATEYTRAGNFSLDANGNLVAANGLNVLGYPTANGVVNTNAPLAPINVPVGAVLDPKATTTMNMTANLDSAATAGAQFPAQ